LEKAPKKGIINVIISNLTLYVILGLILSSAQMP
jgi:hypothetical protein